MASRDQPTQRLEKFHLGRALLWPMMLPTALVLGWENSVFFVLCLSLYANCASDISAWQAARAERRSLENP